VTGVEAAGVPADRGAAPGERRIVVLGDGWVPLAAEATSPWQYAGSAEYTWGQAGWTFAISVPPGQN
jgi:hypothetical protein